MASSSSTRKPVNMRNWAVKRIMQEAAELSDPDTDDFVAGPLEVSEQVPAELITCVCSISVAR
jgi:hypothetical protein